jgi:hypothetical protein
MLPLLIPWDLEASGFLSYILSKYDIYLYKPREKIRWLLIEALPET